MIIQQLSFPQFRLDYLGKQELSFRSDEVAEESGEAPYAFSS
jgi:hypothetical protein